MAAPLVTLRPYQLTGIDLVREEIRKGKRRIVFAMPTGGGKGVIAAHLMWNALGKGKRALFMAHRRMLVTQQYKRLLAYGLPRETTGILMAGLKGNEKKLCYRPTAPTQVGSIETVRRMGNIGKFDLIIIDECHRSLSPTYQDFIEEHTESTIVGETATPYRTNGDGLGRVYESLVVMCTPQQLMDDGFLVAPRAFTVPKDLLPDLTDVRMVASDYNEEDLSRAANKPKLVGSIVEHWLRRGERRRTVVGGVDVAHSMSIRDAFLAAGVPAAHVDASTPDDERERVVAAVERGEILILCQVGVFNEGFDLPAIKCLIQARPTASRCLHIQQAGRILRPWGNVVPLILDHAGNCRRHGLPQETCEFTLADIEKSSKRKPGRPMTKECDRCLAVVALAVMVCPECGYEFPRPERDRTPVQIDGELVELTAGREIVVPLPPIEATPQEKWAYWVETCAEAARRGYKKGWAFHRFYDRYRSRPLWPFQDLQQPLTAGIEPLGAPGSIAPAYGLAVTAPIAPVIPLRPAAPAPPTSTAAPKEGSSWDLD